MVGAKTTRSYFITPSYLGPIIHFLKAGPNQSSFIYYNSFTEHINTQINFNPPPGFEPGSPWRGKQMTYSLFYNAPQGSFIQLSVP